MPTALHLIKGGDVGLALATIARQLAAGDTVRLVALHGAAVPSVPPGATLCRVPEELGYEQLLEAIFDADQVIAW
jgi:hypothetical protein